MGANSAGPQLETLCDEQLARLAGAGNEEAFSLLIERCSPMIRMQAKHYLVSNLDAEDLAQEGFLGLLSAVRTYDPEKKASFRTYASVCIPPPHGVRSAACGRRAAGSRTSIRKRRRRLRPSADRGRTPRCWWCVGRTPCVCRSGSNIFLTPLEKRVLFYHLGAYSYEEIAQKLEIGPKTVDNALQRIRRKLSKFPFPSV